MSAGNRPYREAEHSEAAAEDRGISAAPEAGAGRRAQVAALQAAIARLGGAPVEGGTAGSPGGRGAVQGRGGADGPGAAQADAEDPGPGVQGSAALAWRQAEPERRDEVDPRTAQALGAAWSTWLELADAPGRVLAVRAAPGAGALPLVLQLMARAARGGRVAWLEVGGGFHPPSAIAHGVDPERLLVVRAQGLGSLVRAAELLLASGALELIVVAASAVGIVPSLGRRLRRMAVRARQERTSLLWWAETGVQPEPADARLVAMPVTPSLRGGGELRLRGRPHGLRLALPPRVPSAVTELYRPAQRLEAEQALARRPKPRTRGARVRG